MLEHRRPTSRSVSATSKGYGIHKAGVGRHSTEPKARNWRSTMIPRCTGTSSPVTPQRLVALLQQNLDPSTVLSLDAGNNRTWMAHLYQSRQANTFYCPGGTAGMGWGLPAAVALKLVYPDRPVACVTGDGGFMMTVHALSTSDAIPTANSVRRV